MPFSFLYIYKANDTSFLFIFFSHCEEIKQSNKKTERAKQLTGTTPTLRTRTQAMARKFNEVLLVAVAIAIATLATSTTAQRTHVVGDAQGWTVPPNGDAAYSNWAANKIFTVGDILVFNFVSGRHDVAELTPTSFNACNTTSPLSRQTNGPANITLTTEGAHYYICTVPGHCNGGQKLAINVSAAASSPAPQPSSPAPQQSTPSPTPTPTPTPTSAPTPTPTSAPTPTPTSSSATPPPSTGTPPSPSTTTPTATSPAGVTAPPAPDSSAKSLRVAGLFTSSLAIAVGLLY